MKLFFINYIQTYELSIRWNFIISLRIQRITINVTGIDVAISNPQYIMHI